MEFNEKDWIEKVKAAKDMKEVSRLILEYPTDTRSMDTDDQEPCFTEPTKL